MKKRTEGEAVYTYPQSHVLDVTTTEHALIQRMLYTIHPTLLIVLSKHETNHHHHQYRNYPPHPSRILDQFHVFTFRYENLSHFTNTYNDALNHTHVQQYLYKNFPKPLNSLNISPSITAPITSSLDHMQYLIFLTVSRVFFDQESVHNESVKREREREKEIKKIKMIGKQFIRRVGGFPVRVHSVFVSCFPI